MDQHNCHDYSIHALVGLFGTSYNLVAPRVGIITWLIDVITSPVNTDSEKVPFRGY